MEAELVFREGSDREKTTRADEVFLCVTVGTSGGTDKERKRRRKINGDTRLFTV
ncbi:hypothetical protein GI364_06635 [Alicyclobacillus sp. SO9]|nr:hypothetical protein GI364_00060 [Alicyclobacillus sp. SO9]QQE80108.1 hypothetical protein GI364_06635 [Alicyclobacillus sp. SO9]